MRICRPGLKEFCEQEMDKQHRRLSNVGLSSSLFPGELVLICLCFLISTGHVFAKKVGSHQQELFLLSFPAVGDPASAGGLD